MTAPAAARPPDELARFLADHQDEIVAEVAERVAEHRAGGIAVPKAIRAALAAYAGDLRPLDHFRRLGAATARAGQDLDDLQRMLGTAGHVVMRWVVGGAEQSGLRPAVFCRVVDAAFAVHEDIIRAAVQGHRQAASPQEVRNRLVALLTGDDPPSTGALAAAAAAASWPVPEIVAVAVTARRAEELPLQTRTPEILIGERGHLTCLVVPDPGRPGGLPSALDRLPVALGPAVPVLEAATSWRWGHRTYELTRAGALPGDGLVRCTDHLSTLLFFQDTELNGLMVRHNIAPLLELPPQDGRRLGATLLVCLEEGFNAAESAVRLKVHPQTVRYRVTKLRELFGDALRSPDARLELQVALRIWLNPSRQAR